MIDSINRFSNRVENYIKYRPDYPREIVAFLRQNCGLRKESIIADVGCGPGISSRMFLENGNRVFGVEPNAAMRNAAESELSEFPWFIVRDGTSEATNLKAASVDLVIAAQAFHWFEPETTRAEFHRILKPGGYIVLIWNERQLNTTPFLKDYEQFLLKYATDYTKVRHENIGAESLRAFFLKDFDSATFENAQVFDFDGLKGRMLSSSYMPSESEPIFAKMAAELETLFAKHAENGKIKVLYDTNVYFSRV